MDNFPEPVHSKNEIKNEKDLSNYATISDLQKRKVDVDKLKPVSVDLNKIK